MDRQMTSVENIYRAQAAQKSTDAAPPPGQPSSRTSAATSERQTHTKIAMCTCDKTTASLIPQVGSSLNGNQTSADNLLNGASAATTNCKCRSDCPNCALQTDVASKQQQLLPDAQEPVAQQQVAKQVVCKQAKQPHLHQWPLPIRILVEPRSDDSVRCDCRNCQFFSGWCCMPCALLIIIFVIVFWATSKWSAPRESSPPDNKTTTSTTTTTTTTASGESVERALNAFYTIF